jgi:hypothetical protein
MFRSKLVVGLGALALGTALVAAQQNAGSAQNNSTSAQQAAPQRQSSSRLTQPWSRLSDLSDDAKGKIIEIHRKSVAEVNAIRAKEREDIMALLSDAQKKQVAEIEAQGRQRARRGSTTRPATGG